MNFDLQYILTKLKNDTINFSEKNLLINYCVKSALLIINSSNFKYSLPKDLSSLDLANDAISMLFIPDKNYELPLIKALNNWDKGINDNISAKNFLFQLVKKRVAQELSKKLKEYDPFYGKIQRSINFSIEKHKFKKLNWFGVVYIVPQNVDAILTKPIAQDFLDTLPSELFCNRKDKIIANIFKYLIDNDFFPAIPLNSLINKIKHVNGVFLQVLNKNEKNEYYEENIDISKILDKSIKAIELKIELSYLQKDKINFKHAEIYKKIINDFSIDLCNGGVSDKLYDYYLKYEKITIQDFYKFHHQHIDYLLRLLKKEIASHLEI
ncbi:MAG: hypothetical protein N2321_06935 [Melioribacteraceae bacterium]|nr:hypothetical protein [Melioribacteraceae bacterium]